MPNKLDGDSYSELLEHENGAAHFGAWCVIVKIASRCNPRGVLVRGNGKPHDCASLQRNTRIPAEIFEEAIPRLIEIGWLETQDLCDPQVTTEPKDDEKIPQESAVIPHPDAGKRLTNGTEKNRIEKNNNERESVVVVLGREGFKADDPLLCHPNCTLEQAQIAIANVNAMPPGQVANRQGFIAQAIRKGYKLSAKARKANEAEQRRKDEGIREQAEKAKEAQHRETIKLAEQAILALSDDEFNVWVERVYVMEPTIRGRTSPKKTSGYFQLKIYELMRKEQAHARACA